MADWINYAWTQVVSPFVSVTKTNITDCYVSNVAQFPDADDTLEFIAQYGRGILVRLNADSPGERSSDRENRSYSLTVRCYVREHDNTQQSVTSLTEQAKYYWQQNRLNSGNWFDVLIESVTYQETENNANIKYAEIEVVIRNAE